MKAIDIYNFRRNLIQCNYHNINTSYNIIGELFALKESIDFIINSWTKLNINKIKHEQDKTL